MKEAALDCEHCAATWLFRGSEPDDLRLEACFLCEGQVRVGLVDGSKLTAPEVVKVGLLDDPDMGDCLECGEPLGEGVYCPQNGGSGWVKFCDECNTDHHMPDRDEPVVRAPEVD